MHCSCDICVILVRVTSKGPLGARLYSVLFSQGGDTPLHRASASGETAVVSLLLDHDADVHAKDGVSICSDIDYIAPQCDYSVNHMFAIVLLR